MLTLLLASFLVVISSSDLVSMLQTTPQSTGVNTSAELPSADIPDLQKKADSGDAAAQYALGRAYELGQGVPASAEQAASWYRKAAEQKDGKAQNSLGVLYWIGNGVEKDKTEAVRWYRKAARQGNGNAMFNLGAAYYNGEGVSVNDTLAYAWFILSSETGNPGGQDAAKRSQEERPDRFNDACVAIGQMYEKGEDLPKSLDLAVAWYRKAATKGDGDAAISLASLYLNANDYNQARPWCEAAAKAKLPSGYYCLGYLHQHGSGVEANAKEAFRWYEQGARGGNRVAMQAVARMYENGEGTKPDHGQAFVWFLLAARAGNQDAMVEAKRIRSSMTEKEWRNTKKKLPSNFDPKKIDSILQGGDARSSQ
jgi:uncharacterized protein